MPLLKIDDFKPIGSFIENTVRPILDELKECGLEIDIKNINQILTKLMVTHFFSVLVYSIRDIIIVGMIAYLICKTSL